MLKSTRLTFFCRNQFNPSNFFVFYTEEHFFFYSTEKPFSEVGNFLQSVYRLHATVNTISKAGLLVCAQCAAVWAPPRVQAGLCPGALDSHSDTPPHLSQAKGQSSSLGGALISSIQQCRHSIWSWNTVHLKITFLYIFFSLEIEGFFY